MPYEYIEHTADLGFRVYGETLKELFESAIEAVMESMVERKGSSEKKEMEYSDIADTYEDLLVDLLSEIIFQVEVENKVFVDWNVEINDKRIDAQLVYEEFDPRIHNLKLEIKSVTYHNLKIRKEGKYYIAEIVCDI
ncbi:MAG TPA: archease [Candidatus Atribacteria bacterium]|nr:archease [Candidatus Atribacteria bacterium]